MDLPNVVGKDEMIKQLIGLILILFAMWMICYMFVFDVGIVTIFKLKSQRLPFSLD